MAHAKGMLHDYGQVVYGVHILTLIPMLYPIHLITDTRRPRPAVSTNHRTIRQQRWLGCNRPVSNVSDWVKLNVINLYYSVQPE